MENEKYSFMLNGYLLCVSTYLSQISIPQILEKQLERRDIDTVCGYELYQMKKYFIETDVLDFKSFHPSAQLWEPIPQIRQRHNKWGNEKNNGVMVICKELGLNFFLPAFLSINDFIVPAAMSASLIIAAKRIEG